MSLFTLISAAHKMCTLGKPKQEMESQSTILWSAYVDLSMHFKQPRLCPVGSPIFRREMSIHIFLYDVVQPAYIIQSVLVLLSTQFSKCYKEVLVSIFNYGLS